MKRAPIKGLLLPTLIEVLVIAWCMMSWHNDGSPASLFVAGWATGLLMAIWAMWVMSRL